MEKLEFWTLIITAITSLFTGLAAIFSYLAVRKATKSNKIAMKQYQDNIKLSEQNNRPVLDFMSLNYTVDITESYMTDWSKEEQDKYVPRHASSSYLELINIGSRAARNVRITFYYEGLDHIKRSLPMTIKDQDTTKEVMIEVTPISEESEHSYYWFKEKRYEEIKVFDAQDSNYHVVLGTIYNSLLSKTNSMKVYFPKLFVYLNNCLADRLIEGFYIDKYKKINLKLLVKVAYQDPYGKYYIQRFIIKNKIKRLKKGKSNIITAQLIPEEDYENK